MRTPRRVPALISAFLLVMAAVAFATVTPVSGAQEVSQYTANLKSAHVGATSETFSRGSCPFAISEDAYGWHFVLPGNSTVFVDEDISISGATITGVFYDQPTGKHLYVRTDGPGTLGASSALVSGDGSVTEFNLSHVCVPEPDPEPTPTPTPSPTPTPTPSPTPTPTPSPTPTPTETPTGTPTVTPSPTQTPTGTPSAEVAGEQAVTDTVPAVAGVVAFAG